MRIDDWTQIVNESEKLYQNLVGVYHPSRLLFSCFHIILFVDTLLELDIVQYTNVAVYFKLASYCTIKNIGAKCLQDIYQ